MTAQTRRAALDAFAAVPALAIPAVAAAAVATPGDDVELIALAAEIQRLCALGVEIYAKRVDPFNETFYGLVHSTSGVSRATLDEAFAYSRKVGREAAIKERNEIDSQADRLWDRMMAIPAATQAGRAAKVRALLAHVCPEWRGPAADVDDWQIEQVLALLGQFAGMSEEELSAI